MPGRGGLGQGGGRAYVSPLSRRSDRHGSASCFFSFPSIVYPFCLYTLIKVHFCASKSSTSTLSLKKCICTCCMCVIFQVQTVRATFHTVEFSRIVPAPPPTIHRPTISSHANFVFCLLSLSLSPPHPLSLNYSYLR